jgi:hypothetical protein
VRAITIRGQRHELVVEPHQGRVRGQEIVRIVEGRFSEPWAAEYFDPQSAKFHGYSQIEASALTSLKTGRSRVTLKLKSNEGVRVQILYKDGNGETTERVIIPLAVEGVLTFEPIHLLVDTVEARCELRKAVRSFRIDRIEEVMQIETGELLDKSKWIECLPINTEPAAELLKHREKFIQLFGVSIQERRQAQAMPSHSFHGDKENVDVYAETRGDRTRKLGPVIIGLGIALVLIFMLGRCVLGASPSTDQTAQLADSAADVADRAVAIADLAASEANATK